MINIDAFFVALVHDLAEAIVGDITPYCGVSKEEKKRREMDAMQEIAKLIAPRGERLMELFEVQLTDYCSISPILHSLCFDVLRQSTFQMTIVKSHKKVNRYLCKTSFA